METLIQEYIQLTLVNPSASQRRTVNVFRTGSPVRWKTQCRNQQHALDYSAIGDDFISKQNAKLLAVYDQQIEALEKAIHELIEEDTVLKAQVERLTAIKGLALLSVAVLIAETNGFEGFANQPVRRCGQLVSYAGYDVIENQSGNRSGKTATAARPYL